MESTMDFGIQAVLDSSGSNWDIKFPQFDAQALRNNQSTATVIFFSNNTSYQQSTGKTCDNAYGISK
jgi:hypothetical protein